MLRWYSADKRLWGPSSGSCQRQTWESERQTRPRQPSACAGRGRRQHDSVTKIRSGLISLGFTFTSSSVSPSVPLTTYALGTSPALAWSTPMTATSVTPSSPLIWFSSSAGATLWFWNWREISSWEEEHLQTLHLDQLFLSVDQKHHSILNKLFKF